MSEKFSNTKLAMGSFLSVILISSIGKFLEDIYSPMMIYISDSFGATKAQMQLSASIYFTGFVIGVITFGILSDAIGRKICVILGLIMMIMGVSIIATSHDLEYFFCGKFIQGFGGSISSILSQAICRDVYSGKDLNKIYGDTAYGALVFTSIGALIGGQVAYLSDWRTSGYWMTGFLLLSLVFIVVSLKETLNWRSLAAKLDSKPHDLSSIIDNKLARDEPYNTSINAASSKILSSIKLFGVQFTTMLTDVNILSRAAIIGMCGGITFGSMYEGPFFYMEILEVDPDQYSFLYLLGGFSFFGAGLATKVLLKKWEVSKLVGSSIAGTIIFSLLFIIGLHFMISAAIDKQIIAYFSALIQLFVMTTNITVSYNVMASAFRTNDSIGVSTAILISFYYSVISLIIFLIGIYSVKSLFSMPVMMLIISTLIGLVFYISTKSQKLVF